MDIKIIMEKIFFNKAFIGKAIQREKIAILDLIIKRKIK
jgi:hypothetical protein